MKLKVYNDTPSTMLLTIEPSAITFEIEAGAKILVDGEFISGGGVEGEIEYCTDRLVLYLMPGAMVFQGDKQLKHNPKL